jgi:hypothetical protein
VKPAVEGPGEPAVIVIIAGGDVPVLPPFEFDEPVVDPQLFSVLDIDQDNGRSVRLVTARDSDLVGEITSQGMGRGRKCRLNS